ncbi:MAG: lysine biosynthesis protein LysW [Candidatus Methanomethylicia archaeon]
MKALCLQCEGEVSIPEDAVIGEIVTCPDCGSPYEIESIGNGEVVIKPTEIEGEDWGE